MTRKTAVFNQRRPPQVAKDGTFDPLELHKYARDTTDDLRKDLVEIGETAPDMRDRVEFTSEGPGRQRVAHGMSYKPSLFMIAKVRHDGDEAVTVNEYRDADERYLFLRTTAPAGAKITLVLYP